MENIIQAQAQQSGLVPQLAWVKERGGPEIYSGGGDGYCKVPICGLDFGWFNWSECKGNQDLSHHFENGFDDGWITISAGHDCGVLWRRIRILERRNSESEERQSLTVEASGKCSTVEEAVAEASSWDFERQKRVGFAWHKCGAETWVAAEWGDKLEVHKANFDAGDNLCWIWNRRPEQFEALLKVVGRHELSGWSATSEEAMQDAAQAVGKVIEQCFFISNLGGEFEKGKVAGRAELVAQVSQLVWPDVKSG